MKPGNYNEFEDRENSQWKWNHHVNKMTEEPRE